MTSCPTDEILARLLDGALSEPEQEAVAEHVEQCASCLQKLDRMTDVPGNEAWQRVAQLPPNSEAESEIVRRLKLAPRSLISGQFDTSVTPAIDSGQGRSMSTAPIDFEIPSVPGYEIFGILGRGGMGVVFKARQLALQRIVAIKMFQNWAQAGEKELARFRDEADVIARLQHPNIVQIHDVGEIAGRPYFVLEYVAGGNLAEKLDGSPQSPRLASQFIEVLARAVQAAHANGVVHRDLKPANILLTLAEKRLVDTVETTSRPDAAVAVGS